MITSVNNEKVKNVVKLLTNAKARRTQQAFVVEGERIVREVPKDLILECFMSESYEKEYLHATTKACSSSVGDTAREFCRISNDLKNNCISYEVVDDAVFKKMADTQNPQGILCVVKMSSISFEEFMRDKACGSLRLLILEAIQDPGNMGTMIRTAEGAGFDAIIADKNTVDIYNPKVTRSTMGSLFRVPVIYVDDLAKVLDEFKSFGIVSYAAHLRGTCDFDRQEYSDRLAILIGNEGNGLSDEISSMADKLVKIPMHGKLESLNAAVAAALMMYRAR